MQTLEQHCWLDEHRLLSGKHLEITVALSRPSDVSTEVSSKAAIRRCGGLEGPRRQEPGGQRFVLHK